MKRMIAALALGALIATGAFAQLMFGISGVQYFQEDENGDLPSIGEAWTQFQDGEGVYMGGFVELAISKLGFGIAFNYDELLASDYGFFDPAYDQWSYDVNFYLAYHFFKARSFLDPFVQMGIGQTAFDYMNKDEISIATNGADKDDPMMASMYWDFGAGLGVNLGPVGVFAKAMFNSQLEGVVKGTRDNNDPYYTYYAGDEYDIPAFDPMPFKWIFGAKLIL
ncbi:MAG: hypothetical protein A2Z99_18650 [Treponema sp. GWB1_62_6]|nr:MAG: hypothetical protein A2001_08365 [Treponema sp. GWC1_61_84]OHE68278.1 MAG: hypothetical protein A2Z99_18650 [Treponema sp. GWB1_62_6]